MYIAESSNPVAAIRAEARSATGRASPLPRLYRWLVRTWAHSLWRRIGRADARLEQASPVEELRAARRRD